MTDQEINFRINILLSTYDALIGKICKNVRMITIDWKDNFYHILAYFDRPATGEDLEDYKDVVAEILADFPKITNTKEEVKFIDKSFSELTPLKEIVFLRKEELYK